MRRWLTEEGVNEINQQSTCLLWSNRAFYNRGQGLKSVFEILIM